MSDFKVNFRNYILIEENALQKKREVINKLQIDLQKTSDGIKKEEDDLEKEIENLKKRYNDLQKTIENSKQQEIDLQKTNDGIKKEKDDLENSKEIVKKRCNDLRETKKSVKKQKIDFQTMRNDVKKYEDFDRILKLIEHEDFDRILKLIEREIAFRVPTKYKKIPEFKLILKGDGGVGKSTFLKRFVVLQTKHVVIEGIDCTIYSLPFFTNRGPIIFNVWEISNHDYYMTRLQCYIQAQCAIYMFDTNCPKTYKNIPNWHRDITRKCGNIPLALVGNKMDILTRKTWVNGLTYNRKKNLPLYKLSVEFDVNLNVVGKPFLWLARKLAGDNTLHFVAAL